MGSDSLLRPSLSERVAPALKEPIRLGGDPLEEQTPPKDDEMRQLPARSHTTRRPTRPRGRERPAPAVFNIVGVNDPVVAVAAYGDKIRRHGALPCERETPSKDREGQVRLCDREIPHRSREGGRRVDDLREEVGRQRRLMRLM